MKCIVFSDMPFKVQERYNAWAKGKPLTRDVIVHSHIIEATQPNGRYAVATIMVFFDETKHTDW